MGSRSYGASLDELLGRAQAPVPGRGAVVDRLGPLSVEQSHRLAIAFDQCRDTSGFVDREAGKRQLEGTNLAVEMLQSIWHLSDLDRDGRLSLREFVCAMYLAEQVSLGNTLPRDIRPEQQAQLARSVEPLIAHTDEAAPATAAANQRRMGKGFHAVESAVESNYGSRTDSRRGVPAGMDGSPQRQMPTRSSSQPCLMGSSSQEFFTSNGSSSNIPGISSRKLQCLQSLAEHSPLSANAGYPGFNNNNSSNNYNNISSSIDRHANPDKLDQLATVFNMAAKNPTYAGELGRMVNEVVTERQSLSREVERYQQSAEQRTEVTSALEHVRSEIRIMEDTGVRTRSRVTHLESELAFVEAEVRGTEQDLALLQDSTVHRQTGDAEREWYQLQNMREAVRQTRQALVELVAIKRGLEADQQHFAEQQRHHEQDRNLLLAGLEAEYTKLQTLREQRLKMREERYVLEKQAMELEKEITPTPAPSLLTTRPVGNPFRQAAQKQEYVGLSGPPFYHPTSSANAYTDRAAAAAAAAATKSPLSPSPSSSQLPSAASFLTASPPSSSLFILPPNTASPKLPSRDHRGIRHQAAAGATLSH